MFPGAYLTPPKLSKGIHIGIDFLLTTKGLRMHGFFNASLVHGLKTLFTEWKLDRFWLRNGIAMNAICPRLIT